MPLAILGLPALGSIVGTMAVKAVEFFFSKAAKRLAVMTLVIGAAYIALQGLLVLIATYATPLLSSLPPEIIATAQMGFPSNTSACIAAIIAAEIGCISYSVTIKALEYQSRIV